MHIFIWRCGLKRIIFIVLAILLLLISFVSCNNDKVKEYIYTKETVTYTDFIAGFRKDMETTESNNVRFMFESDISIEDRAECIDLTLSIVSAAGGICDKKTVCVFKPQTFDERFVTDDILFVPVSELNSLDYVIDLLLLIHGRYTNYGLAYGYASYLSDVDSEGFAKADNKDTYDLNLLCFDTQFISEEDTEVAKTVAVDFVASYIEDKGEDKLKNLIAESDTFEGVDVLGKEMSTYYKKNGLEYVPSLIMYTHGGKTLDYIACTEFAEFYIDKEWIDGTLSYNPKITAITKDFLHSDYSEIKEFYEINMNQMREYQELFAIEGYRNDLDIIITNSENIRGSAYQGGSIHKVTLQYIISLMHEYIHSLTIGTLTIEDKTFSRWEGEGFARYYQNLYDYYGHLITDQDWNTLPESDLQVSLAKYRESLGRPIETEKDYIEIYDFFVYDSGKYDPDFSYEHGASFVKFLVDKYGDETVIHSVYGRREQLPEIYENLIAEWTEYIKAKFDR